MRKLILLVAGLLFLPSVVSADSAIGQKDSSLFGEVPSLFEEPFDVSESTSFLVVDGELAALYSNNEGIVYQVDGVVTLVTDKHTADRSWLEDNLQRRPFARQSDVGGSVIHRTKCSVASNVGEMSKPIEMVSWPWSPYHPHPWL